MATKIFHGAPGSYKSSTAMWFEIVPALRAGRVVVTNLQGIKTLEVIQKELDEIFPNTARLLRISIGNDLGMTLMRNFYHWLPIGALIFLDEIQDIYPNDKSFKASDYDYVQEGAFDEHLPNEFKEIYHQEQRAIKGSINIEDYLDDIGESLFDERDYLRYPRTLRECFMRHRHYNWDILIATPDIKEVSTFVRSVCEVAYAHVSKDAMPLPYFKRRPRILEHSPKSNGITVGKNDITSYKKVPLDVFKLYKSTATGKSTKSGAGQSPFTSTVIFGFIAVLAVFVYLFYFILDKTSADAPKETLKNSSVQEVKDKKALSKVPESQKQVAKSGKEVPDKRDPISFRHDSFETMFTSSRSLIKHFGVTSIYVNGISTVIYDHNRVERDYVFTMYSGEQQFTVDSDFFKKMGYKIFYKSECLLELRYESVSNYIFCEPNKIETHDDGLQQTAAPNVSLI
ncbi:zonular occludens toxin family protein [Colwellia sp. RE-S-Sl-9]